MADWPVQPTCVDDLAQRLLELRPGIQHAIGADETTWAEVASAVAVRLGVPERVRPIRLTDLGLGARPLDARLAPADLPGWRSHLDLLAG